ncbi:hypothetical protein [Shewanella mangrovisoli]|uniref:hypothetical protein n=1 Tax=Shewanella mangrovisoli TaxID=2864211 RepID=UPI0035B6EC43
MSRQGWLIVLLWFMGDPVLIRHKATLDISGGLWLGKELEISAVDVNLLVDMDYFSVLMASF